MKIMYRIIWPNADSFDDFPTQAAAETFLRTRFPEAETEYWPNETEYWYRALAKITGHLVLVHPWLVPEDTDPAPLVALATVQNKLTIKTDRMEFRMSTRAFKAEESGDYRSYDEYAADCREEFQNHFYTLASAVNTALANV